jgi:hypothetical protein
MDFDDPMRILLNLLQFLMNRNRVQPWHPDYRNYNQELPWFLLWETFNNNLFLFQRYLTGILWEYLKVDEFLYS